MVSEVVPSSGVNLLQMSNEVCLLVGRHRSGRRVSGRFEGPESVTAKQISGRIDSRDNNHILAHPAPHLSFPFFVCSLETLADGYKTVCVTLFLLVVLIDFGSLR